MDSLSVTLKPNTHLRKPTQGGICNGFLGQRVRESVGNRVWVNRASKALRVQNCVNNAKPGLVRAVIASKDMEGAVTWKMEAYNRPRVDPKNVASIILGGGAGTQLFPLTSKAATPAVPVGGCYRLIDIPMSNCYRHICANPV